MHNNIDEGVRWVRGDAVRAPTGARVKAGFAAALSRQQASKVRRS